MYSHEECKHISIENKVKYLIASFNLKGNIL